MQESVEIPQELHDKFDKFIALVFELHKKRAELYPPLCRKICRIMEEMKMDEGLVLNGLDLHIHATVKVDKEDPYKILTRSIVNWERIYPRRSLTKAGMCLTRWILEMEAGKVPEPEVLITDEAGYKLSREWMNWHSAIFTDLGEGELREAAGARAIEKHFQRPQPDYVEATYQQYVTSSSDVEVRFHRVVRENLTLGNAQNEIDKKAIADYRESYVYWESDDSVYLDGSYDADQLRTIIRFMENGGPGKGNCKHKDL